MAITTDTLRYTGLDTLSERALRRLTERWTGELYPLDSLSTEQHAEVASPQTFTQIVEGWQRAREMYHDASMEAVLGDGSSLMQGVVSHSDSLAMQTVQPLYDAEVMLSRGGWSLGEWSDWIYNLLVAVMFVYYLFCICRYFDDIKALFASIFNSKVRNAGRAGERRRSDIFYGALGKLFMLGVCFVGLFSALTFVRAGVIFEPLSVAYIPFAVIGAFLVIIVAQYLLLGAVGFVTQSYGEVASLMRIRLTYFVLSTVLVAPIMLMALTGVGASADAWLKVSFVAIGVVMVMFIRESVGFFISKKVSILHWILYLCTVEILPLSLLWQVAKSLR